MNPQFSIVIPMFNRATLIGRAIESCLAQDRDDLEVIVVDDGSTDGSPEVVRAFTDPRVRLELLERNSGQNTARNRGAQVARGEWLVFLDSDDELTPDALSTLARRIAETPGVEKFYLSCVLDDGTHAPTPPFTGEVWGYEQFVRFLEAGHGHVTECIPCTRRARFMDVPYSEGHALEGIHELDFVKRWPVRGCPEVGRVYHADAQNNSRVMAATRFLQISRAFARDAHDIVTRHGDALARWAPSVHREALGTAALHQFGAGHRLRGLRYAAAYLRRRPRSLTAWAIPLVGILGRRPLAWAHEWGHRVARGRPLRVSR